MTTFPDRLIPCKPLEERIEWLNSFIDRNNDLFLNKSLFFDVLYNIYLNQVAPELKLGPSQFYQYWKKCLTSGLYSNGVFRKHKDKKRIVFEYYNSELIQKK